MISFSACSPKTIPTPTNTPQPTNTPEPTKTSEPTAPPSIEPSPTILPYQMLGRIFPEGYDSVGVWANQNTGAEDSRNTHFDVALPKNYLAGKDVVISPASGKILEVYSVGDNGEGGQVITIEPNPPLEGIKQLAIDKGLDPLKIQKVYFHIGHIVAYKTEGFVEKGEIIGSPFDIPGTDKIAYVIRIIMGSNERQYSPCDLPNITEFCGKCAPGTKNPCP